MIYATDKCVTEFLNAWHEAGRETFEKQYSNLDYDSEHYVKTAEQKRKYIYLNDGRSGAFILDRQTGDVYCIKGYGVPDKKKRVGNIHEVTGGDAIRCRWWNRRYGNK